MNIKLIKHPFLRSYLSFLLFLAGIFVIYIFGTSSQKPDKIETPKAINTVVSGITIPENLDFAGEKVPLNYFDVKEALDRELLINTYWQSQTLLIIKRSTRYFDEIELILKKNNIPDDFKYLSLAESGFLNVTSPAGAVGFWQFVPSTARDYGLEINSEVDERYNLLKSTEAACKFLQQSYNIYKSWTMAAASYNMGRKALGKQIQRQLTGNYYDILLNDETSRYIYRILALKIILNNPVRYGFNILKADYYQSIPYTELILTQSEKDLALFSVSKGTNYKILKILNPWLRDNSLTIKENKSYIIRIPVPGFRQHGELLKKEDSDVIEKKSDEEDK
jgi:hypothetical protein